MTEEKEQSSEVKEEDLEALNDAASAEEETSPAEEPEKGVPIAKHVALRHRAQSAEIAQARAEGELNALRQHQASQKPAAKSPLDLEIERQANMGILEEDMTITPALYRKQQLYDQQVANQTAESDRQHALGKIQKKSIMAAQANHEDWQQAVARGDGLLTPGEVLDIVNTGDGFGELYYAKLQEAIERNAPKSESKLVTAPKEKPSKLEAEKVPTQQEILNNLHADPQTIAAAQL